jgi:hypothetical protein
MTSAATEAKIGRAMKKWLNRIGVISYIALLATGQSLALNVALN